MREPVEPSPDESGTDQPSPDRPNPDQPAADTTDDATFYSKGPLRLRGSQVPTTTTRDEGGFDIQSAVYAIEWLIFAAMALYM
ncbi:hypothetical protein KC220_22090, partial [Mycobacterium tuberculosis]|nr:hypothetical protein [Mycobacterium tuberculosis]